MWIDAAAVVKGLSTPRLHESGMQRAVPKLRAGLTHTPARLRRARLTEPAPRPSACAHRECCYGAVPDGQFHAQIKHRTCASCSSFTPRSRSLPCRLLGVAGEVVTHPRSQR